jgi:hypothetical protein
VTSDEWVATRGAQRIEVNSLVLLQVNCRSILNKSSDFWNLVDIYNSDHVRWVPCHHGIARPQVADGGDLLQFWRVAANILNKQSQIADKGWSSSLGVGRGANNSSPHLL